MNSSQMDWEHIGTTRIEQFVEQADAEAHGDKHNDKQKKMDHNDPNSSGWVVGWAGWLL